MNQGGRAAPAAAAKDGASQGNGRRVLSAVLALEVLWLLLVVASVVFLAAHLGADADDFPSDPVARRVVLLAMPPVAVVLGLALLAARQGVENRALSPTEPLDGWRRGALWLSAAANLAVVVSIVTSLYHAHTTWIVVGVALASAFAVVAWACVRTARHSVARTR